MFRKVLIPVVAVAAAAAGVVTAAAGSAPVASVRATAPVGCPSASRSIDVGDGSLASGLGSFAAVEGSLVMADGSALVATSSGPERGDGQAIVRHVTGSPGVGTAYVIDRPGDDTVVAVTPSGVRRFDGGGEATHPAFSPAADLAWAVGSSVALVRPEARRVRRIPGPVRGGTVFSPVFVPGGGLAVVAAAPPTPTTPEGGRLDALWLRHGGAWERLTSFLASGERWVNVRTPVLRGGSIWFVRVTGHASATHEPRFELWRTGPDGARLVRGLPDERYLAGSRGGRLVWNVPDVSSGRMAIVVDGPTGARVIGCGAVMTDPIDAVDPDRRARGGTAAPPRGDWPELEVASEGDVEQIAVIVGDFEAESEARAVVDAIAEAYPGARVEVTDAARSPLAIGPGVFGALLHLPPDADATEALAEFRERLPQYAPSSWVVTP